MTLPKAGDRRTVNLRHHFQYTQLRLVTDLAFSALMNINGTAYPQNWVRLDFPRAHEMPAIIAIDTSEAYHHLMLLEIAICEFSNGCVQPRHVFWVNGFDPTEAGRMLLVQTGIFLPGSVDVPKLAALFSYPHKAGNGIGDRLHKMVAAQGKIVS